MDDRKPQMLGPGAASGGGARNRRCPLPKQARHTAMHALLGVSRPIDRKPWQTRARLRLPTLKEPRRFHDVGHENKK